MSEYDGSDKPGRTALIEKNIDLAFRFIDELIEDSEKLGQIPSGSTVYVIPQGEPEFNREQLERARSMAQSGAPVGIWQLDAPPGERTAFKVRTTTPCWPTKGLTPRALYDRARDLLIVDFFGGSRAGARVDAEAFGILFVDVDTDEIVVHILPSFLGQAVARDPALIDVLLRPETELRGVSRDEVRVIKNDFLQQGGGLAAETATFEMLTEHLQLLTA